MKEKQTKNKAARGLFKLYFGLFSAVCAFAAAFAWFEGTISKNGIDINTGKIEVTANAYTYDNTTTQLTRLGSSSEDEHLVLNISQKEQRDLFIIVDRTVASIEVEYFLNLGVENGKGEGLTQIQRDEQTRYITGFTYTFAKLTDAVDATTVPQRTFPDTPAYNNYEKRLNSYIYNCKQQTNPTVYPTTPSARSLAELSDENKQDKLENATYANYYVFSYNYGSDISQLTDRTIQLSLNINYAQLGGLTESERSSDTIYCTTQNQFNAAVKEYLPGQTIQLSTNVTYTKDLVFQAPVNLVLKNCTLTVQGSLIFSYPYNERSSIDTKTNSKILIQSVNSSGGYFEIDTPNGEFEIMGKGKSATSADIYVQKEVEFNCSYNDGITLSSTNIQSLTSSGAIPSTATFKDIGFDDNTKIVVGTNTRTGKIGPYISSTDTTATAPKRVFIVIYDTVARINLSSMGLPPATLTAPQIYIESYGNLLDPQIVLPFWAEKWEEDADNPGTYLGNTKIFQHFVSCDLTANTTEYYQYTNPFVTSDIELEQRTVYVVLNNADGTDITIYYSHHNGITTLEGLLKEFYYGTNGYADSLAVDFNEKMNNLLKVQIICDGTTRISSTDQTFIQTWKSHIQTLDLEKAKYVNDRIEAYYFAAFSVLTELSIPDTTAYIGNRFISSDPLLKEITIPASVSTLDRSAFYDSDTILSFKRVFHVKSLTCHTYMDLMSTVYVGVDPSVRDQWVSTNSSRNTLIGCDGTVTSDWKYVYNRIDTNKYRIERCLVADMNNQNLVLDQIALNATQNGIVSEIANYAFISTTNFADVTINSNVSSIGTGAFLGRTFNNLVVNGCNTIGGYAFSSVTSSKIEIRNVNRMESYSCESLKTTDLILDNIGYLASYSFYRANIYGQATLSNIRNACGGVFYSCNINSITTSNITLIDGRALFIRESTITTFNFGSNATVNAQSNYFAYFNTITTLNMNNTSGFINVTFNNCTIGTVNATNCTFDNYGIFIDSKITNFNISGCTFASKSALNGMTVYNPMVIKNCVFTAASGFGNSKLNNVSFIGVTTLSDSTFSGADIATMDLSGVTTLGNSCFYKAKVDSFINANSLITIGESCFRETTYRVNKTFSSTSLVNVGNSAFRDSGTIECIDIRNASNIGSVETFIYCPNLVMIIIKHLLNTTSYDSLAFSTPSLKYFIFTATETYAPGAINIKINQTTTGNTATYICSKNYYDAIGSSDARNKKFAYYTGNIANDLHIFGTATLEGSSVVYGDGIFYFNGQRDSDNNPCVTILCLSATSITGTTYNTPDTITYQGNTYKVTGLDFAYNNTDIDVGTFNVSANTKSIKAIAAYNNEAVKITTFNGNSLTTVGDYFLYRCNVGTVNLNNVTSYGQYCFRGTATGNNMGTFGKIYLNNATSGGDYSFAYCSASEVYLNSLTTVSNSFHSKSQFGRLELNGLTSYTSSFDPYQSNWGYDGNCSYYGSSFGYLSMNALTSISDQSFSMCAQINELYMNSLQTITKQSFVSISVGPAVLRFPCLKSVDTQSYYTVEFGFSKGVEVYDFPELTYFRGCIYIGEDAKQLTMPKLSSHSAYINASKVTSKLKIINFGSLSSSYNTFRESDSYKFKYGTRDLYFKEIGISGTSCFINGFLNYYVDNIFLGGTEYSSTAGSLPNRSSYSIKVNVYVRHSVYENITSTVMNNYGYNFIDCGDFNPCDLYYNGYGTITDGHFSEPEYIYAEETNSVTLVKCNKDSYTGSLMSVGGNVSITKTVSGSTTTYSKPITKLASHLYSHTQINVSRISISSTVSEIAQDAFDTNSTKTCGTLEMENTGTIKTGSFSGLNITGSLAIHNLSTMEVNSMPKVNGVNIKIFKTDAAIASTGAFGASANTSTLQVPASMLSQYNTASWNGIPTGSISTYDSSFTTTDGAATVTYYYKEVGSGLDITYATSSAPLTTVHIPASATISSVSKNIEVLESQALAGLGAITGVELPATLKAYVYDRKFEPITLTNYSLAGTSSYFSVSDGVLFNADGSRLISYPKAKADAAYTVPATVTTISSGAFSDNTRLGTVTIAPTSSVTILDNAFKGCSGLTSLTITGNAVLNDYALADTDLVNVTITGTSTIGAYAFDGCDSLATINFGGKASIQSYAFVGSNENIVLTFTGATPSEFVGRNIFQGIVSYSIKVPAGTLASYYENVLYDLSILSHIQEVAA